MTNYPGSSTRRARRWPWIVGVVVAFVAGVGAGSIGQGDDVGSAAATSSAPSEEEPVEETTEPEPEPEPEPESESEPEYDEPTADSFELSVKTLQKKCFGSAGCNVTFRIEVAATDPMMSLDPSKTYELTYEIEGSEDPYINTLTIQGDGYEVDSEEFVSTASDVELEAVVTVVSEF